jgi:hypothetical protein
MLTEGPRGKVDQAVYFRWDEARQPVCTPGRISAVYPPLDAAPFADRAIGTPADSAMAPGTLPAEKGDPLFAAIPREDSCGFTSI